MRKKFRVFWDVAPYSHVEVDRHFRGTHSLHRRTSETSVKFNVTTRRYIPEYSKLRTWNLTWLNDFRKWNYIPRCLAVLCKAAITAQRSSEILLCGCHATIAHTISLHDWQLNTAYCCNRCPHQDTDQSFGTRYGLSCSVKSQEFLEYMSNYYLIQDIVPCS
jgi:hypothetical protein